MREIALQHLNRSRYYDAGQGRFLQEDSYPGSDLTPPSLHRYTYVHNNPVRYVDPSGQSIDWVKFFKCDRINPTTEDFGIAIFALGLDLLAIVFLLWAPIASGVMVVLSFLLSLLTLSAERVSDPKALVLGGISVFLLIIGAIAANPPILIAGGAVATLWAIYLDLQTVVCYDVYQHRPVPTSI